MLYRFRVTCPRCGSDVVHVTRGEVATLDRVTIESKAVVECVSLDCMYQTAIVVQVAATREPAPQALTTARRRAGLPSRGGWNGRLFNRAGGAAAGA